MASPLHWPVGTMPATPFESVSLDQLVNVTGGCQKSPPPPQEDDAPTVQTSVQVSGFAGVAPVNQQVVG